MISIPDESNSYWVASTPPTKYRPLKGKVVVDVAVIGGGIAGVTAAYQLKSIGAKVALLEAYRIAAAVTGYTTAKVTSQHHLIYHELTKKFGQEGARAYGEANEAALAWIAGLAEKKKFACDFRRKSAYVYAATKEELPAIEAEIKAAQELGLPATFTERTTLPYEIEGAIRFADQAEFHPRKFLLAIAKEISGQGSHLSEESRVREVKDGSPCQVHTEHGTVIAKNVLIATHFPIQDRAFYFARMWAKSSYAVMVKTPERIPDGIFISAEHPIRSLRSVRTPKGERLLVVGEAHKTGQGGDTLARYRRLAAFAKRHFNATAVEYRWSTEDYLPHDRVPFIGKFTPRSKHLYVATGFQAWGMTNGVVAALIFADLAAGHENPWAFLFNPNRLGTFFTKKSFAEAADNTKKFIGDRWRSRKKGSLAQLKPREGKLIQHGKTLIGAYKDENGKVYAVSPVCTHMGCIVQWNNAEKTWDCPCHGSFYNYDGTVFHGPATKNLKKIKVK